MGHLPYPEDIERGTCSWQMVFHARNVLTPVPVEQRAPLAYPSPTMESDPRWVEYHAHPSVPAPTASQQDMQDSHPHRAQEQGYRPSASGDPSSSQAGPSRARPTHAPAPPSTSNNIALPARPRSPPLIEDPPKKPLTLACLFCRKRKIACGSPPSGSPNRTCKYVRVLFFVLTVGFD